MSLGGGSVFLMLVASPATGPSGQGKQKTQHGILPPLCLTGVLISDIDAIHTETEPESSGGLVRHRRLLSRHGDSDLTFLPLLLPPWYTRCPFRWKGSQAFPPTSPSPPSAPYLFCSGYPCHRPRLIPSYVWDAFVTGPSLHPFRSRVINFPSSITSWLAPRQSVRKGGGSPQTSSKALRGSITRPFIGSLGQRSCPYNRESQTRLSRPNNNTYADRSGSEFGAHKSEGRGIPALLRPWSSPCGKLRHNTTTSNFPGAVATSWDFSFLFCSNSGNLLSL